MLKSNIWLVGLVGMALVGCASGAVAPTPHDAAALSYSSAPLVLPETAAVGSDAFSYCVGPLDILTFRIFSLEKARELSTFDVEVDAGGSVFVPFAGAIAAGGKATDEIRALVIARLSANVLLDPQVTVTVKEYRSRPITVLGAVEKGGVFYLQRNTVTLTEALSLAGGPSARVGTRAFVLVPGAGNAPPRRIDVDLVSLLLDGDAGWNIPIGPHSTVSVLPAEELFVVGFVPHPGSVAYHRPLTVTQAVGLAGGVDEKTGSPSTVEVTRSSASGTQVFEVNLTDIAAGDKPDIQVFPRDTIAVRRTFLKALIEFIESLGSHIGAGYAL